MKKAARQGKNKYIPKPVTALEKTNVSSASNYRASQSELERIFPRARPSISTHNQQQKFTKLQTMAIAREAVVNDPAMVSALRTTRASIIGGGWSLSLSPKEKILGITFNEAYDFANYAEELFNTYAKSPDCHFDICRQMTFDQIIAAAFSSYTVNGDAFAIMGWKPSSNGFYTCLNLIDPARVQTPSDRQNDASVKNGIEIDKYGEPINFFVLDNDFKHNFSNGFTNLSSDFLQIKSKVDLNRPLVLHAFDVKHPEQTTGSSDYHSGIIYLKLVSQYLKNENQRMALQASFGMAIKSNEDYTTLMSGVLGKKDAMSLLDELTGLKQAGVELNQNHTQQLFDELGSDSGSKIVHLLPNEEIQMLQKGDNINSLDGFTRVLNKLIAASVGSDYSSTFQDHSDISYSAARFALSQAETNFNWIKYVIERKFAMPFVYCFFQEAIDKGVLKLPRSVTNFNIAKDFLFNGGFISNGKPIIDPYKEAKADTESISNGTMSRDDVCAKRGVSYKDVAKAREREKRLEMDLGLWQDDKNEAKP